MRLATKDEFVRLCKCYTRFDESLHGRWFFDKETGEELFFPCEGMLCYDTIVDDDGSFGHYWSSTYISTYNAYLFDLHSEQVFQASEGNRCYGRSVRLVSDTPFDGAVHVAGLYWKTTNEDGYYTWDDAMEKFNSLI